MSGMSITDVRVALAAQLAANIDAETNIDAFGISKPLPCIRISLAEPPQYTASYGGVAVVPFVLTIQPGGVDESSVRRLDAYLSAGLGNNSSVVDALRVDKTLGGVAQLVEIAPLSYDAGNVMAELSVVVHVLKIRA